jgi:hypothetical protein
VVLAGGICFYSAHHDVADEAIRYHIVLNNLDSSYTEQVAEVITPMPAATPCTVLKNAIIKRFTGSRESEIRKLVSQQDFFL